MNQCTLQGRLSAGATERQLPSGDSIASFRLIVPRQEPGRVDTIDCVVRKPALRKRVMPLEAGAVLMIEGALHRRFWRAPGGPTSRYEVEVAVVRKAV